MELEVGKTYLTRDGNKVRILATDIKNTSHPVAGALSFNNNEEGLLTWTKEGKFYKSSSEVNKDDLISEYSFWNDVPIDTKILVRDYRNKEWQHKHFAKYEDGIFYAYSLGATSWSNCSRETLAWKYAKLYEEDAKC